MSDSERDRLVARVAELESAIRRLADQDATLSVQGGNVIVDMDPHCPYVTGKTTRYCTLTPFTLTAAEREAIEGAITNMESRGVWAWPATLRGLLERTK